MSELDTLLREYRETCFLVRDNKGNDKAVDLLAHQNVLTKEQFKLMLLEMLNKACDTAAPLTNLKKWIEEL